MRFLALDLETGGLDPDRHQLLQIGLAEFDNGEVGRTLAVQLSEHAKLDITLRALRLTGTTMADLKAGVDEAQAYAKVRDWVEEIAARELPIVSHNASFDQSFWSQFIFRQGSWQGRYPDKVFVQADPLLYGAWACTRRLGAHLRLPNQTLDTIAAHFGLSRATEKHGALEDAILAGRVFDALAKLRQEQAA
jgi:DNA polymerase III epsilon subunit-like protein